jgi:DNA helicase-2/ATP-dependent DNA helicase PcrA
MFDFIDEFIDHGIPFTMLTDGRMWTDRVQDYVSAIEKAEAGDPVNGLEARRLADMLQDSAFGTHDRDEFYDFLDDREEAADADDVSLIEVTADELDEHIPFMPDTASADDMVRKVTSFQRKSMGAYFDGDYEGMDPTRVRVGTIHSAKGREADHVFVATDLTEKVVEQMAASIEDPTDVDGVEEFTKATSPVPVLTDNERRVFYVGMSRARERLVIMESLISGAPTLPISVLLFNELRDETPEELVEEAQAELAVPEPEP